MDHDPVTRLGELLRMLADPQRTQCSWWIKCQLGDAGQIVFAVDVNPQQISIEDRDILLSFAARLANWDHPVSYHGRYRAEDITLDITIENLARYRAYDANTLRTYYTGHLGTVGRHEAEAPR